MKAQELKRQMLLQEWASQIKVREESGMSVKQWCAENGPSLKTYYYRLKQVREELLESLANSESQQLSVAPNNCVSQMEQQIGTPPFVALPIPQSKNAAVTVWIGGYAIAIQNGAEESLMEQTLRVVSRL